MTVQDEVALTYFGDGASSQGDANEAFDWAPATSAPALFFCQNNQWAISTPTCTQMRTPLHQHGRGPGLESYLVDGNDVLAVHAVHVSGRGTGSRRGRPSPGRGPAVPQGRAQHLQRPGALPHSQRPLDPGQAERSPSATSASSASTPARRVLDRGEAAVLCLGSVRQSPGSTRAKSPCVGRRSWRCPQTTGSSREPWVVAYCASSATSYRTAAENSYSAEVPVGATSELNTRARWSR